MSVGTVWWLFSNGLSKHQAINWAWRCVPCLQYHAIDPNQMIRQEHSRQREVQWYQLTNFTEENLSWEADSHPVGHKIPRRVHIRQYAKPGETIPQRLIL